MNKIESILKLDSLAFDEIHYKRGNIDKISSQYEMNFNRTIRENGDGIHYRVTLSAKLKSEDGNVTMDVSLIGFFSCECEDENMKNYLIRENSIAILFPYLRSQISLVSTQPNMPPIVIPPINIVSLFESSEQINE